MSPRRRTILTVSVLLVIVAAAAALGIWRVLGSSPDEVSLEEAVADAEAAQSESAVAPDETALDAQPGADDNADPSTATSDDTVSSVAADDDMDDAHDGTDDASDSGDDGHDDDGGDAAAGGRDGDGDADAAEDIDSLDGIWEVDATSGTFTLDDATGSFAGFRVEEELARIGAFTAVGRTGDVSGTVVIIDEHAENAEIKVGLASLQTDDSRRDRAVRQALNTDDHPFATFSLTEVMHLEGGAELEGPFPFDVEGDFTVNGTTRPVTAKIETQLVGSVIVVVGRFEVTFEDYGIRIPQVPIVLSAEDHGIVEFQLLLRRS